TPGGPGVGVLNWDFTFQAVDNGVLWSVHATWSGVVPNQFGAYPPFCQYGGQTNADAATLAAVVSQDPVFSSPVYLPGMVVTVTATDLSEVWVDDDYTAGGANGGHIWGYTAFDNIQDAVDGVNSGGTVNVAAGTYEEQVHITTSDLTIMGAGFGDNPTIDTIVMSPATLTWFYHTSKDNYPIVGLDGVTGVILQNLRIDGAGRGNANYRFQGLGLWNSGGDVIDVTIVNVRDTPFSGSQHGVGVYSYNDTDGPYTINLTGVVVTDYQKGAIALNGAGLTANVVDCTTTGYGATDITAQNGIQMSGGNGGTISGCSVTGNMYYPTPEQQNWAATGILLIDAGTVAVSNTNCTDNDPAMIFQDTHGSVDNVTVNNTDVESGGAVSARIYNVVAPRIIPGDDDIRQPLPISPFGDEPYGNRSGNRSGDRGTRTITVNDCDFNGHAAAYGVSASCYQATEDISLTVTDCSVDDWGWCFVMYAMGGEVMVTANNNAITGAGGRAYAFSSLTSTFDFTGNYYGINDAATLTGMFSSNVDFSPWLGLTPGTTPMSWYTNDSIQDAIDMAAGGDEINITEGTYVAPAQIVVAKDLDLLGAGSTLTTIEPGFNTTTGSYDLTAALIYVAHGITAAIEDLAIDGSGYTVRHGIQTRGTDLTVRNCDIRDIYSSIYAGRGIVFLTGTGLVENCTMSNIQRIGIHIRGHIEPTPPTVEVNGLTYTGKGDGDFLDYGIEIGGGGHAVISNSTLTDCRGLATVDGSTSGGILATDYYGTITTAAIETCILTGNTTGLLVGYDETDLSEVTIHNSAIADNVSFGVSSTAPVVDALNNWWGSSLGPLHPVTNPGGLGNEVSDFILFDPWFGGNVIIDPDPQTIALVDGSSFQKEVVCEYLGGGSGLVYGYSIDLLYDAGILDAVITEPDNGPFASAVAFQVTSIAGGVRIDAALGGAAAGIANGELFKATLTGTGCGTSDLDLSLTYFRDNANQPLSGFVADDGEVRIDMIAPTVVNAALVRTNLLPAGYAKDGDNLQITADFADACGGFAGLTITADLSDLLIGGGTAVVPTSAVDPLATWTLTGVALTGDGTKTVTLKAVDPLGNEVSTTVSIIVDNTAPAAVTDITAAPHHEEVEVGWTHDGTDVYRYWIYRGMWYDTTPAVSAYPEYDNLVGEHVPDRPAAGALPSPGQGWVRADADDLGFAVDSFFDVFFDLEPLDPPRGVYYYEVFAVDAAGNYSDPATVNDRATNYWLGDVSDQGSGTYGVFDGLVSGADITQLGTYYGTSPVVAAGKPIDIGPTDDYSRVGIPTTDDRVDFEDLMIFSMNYGVVAPLPIFQENATELAQISWRRVEESVWSLVLDQPCLDLKGLNISSRMIVGSVISVQPGALCGQQAGQVFLRNIDANGLDAGLALMGT
ncbi:MAG: hypothetical protein GY835_10085, partial [bacterium]|nr:hypothetical protein [bacterium]